MSRSIAAGGALLAALALSACGGGRDHYIVQGSDSGRLTLSATAEERAAPDIATISAGVVAEQGTADAAMAQQRERMTAIMTALSEAGIAETDIQTSGLSLSPVRAPFERGQQERPIVGYRASNQVTVIVRDLGEVGSMLDALVAAGANTINNVRFDIEEAEGLRDAARRRATETVLARAALYADAGGFRLGRIMQLSEGGTIQPLPFDTGVVRTAAAEAAPTPIAPGELELHVTVTAVFEIDDRS